MDDDGSFSHKFSSLNSSTQYTIHILVIAGEQINQSTEPLKPFTKPEEINYATLLERRTNSLMITVSYDGGNEENITYSIKMYSGTLADLKNLSHCGEDQHQINFPNRTTFEATNLTSGTKYNFQIFSCLNGIESEDHNNISYFTKPQTPSFQFYQQEKSSLGIEWYVNAINAKEDIAFVIKPVEGNQSFLLIIKTFGNLSGTHTFGNLSAGEYYTVVSYTIIHEDDSNEIRSEGNFSKSAYTKPGMVQNITAVPSLSNESCLYIKWDETLVGHYDNFTVNATCKSPNTDTTMKPDIENWTNTSWTLLGNLDPGTFCNVTVESVIQNVYEQHGSLVGDAVSQIINVSTNETAPGKVNVTNTDTNRNSLTFTWTKPLNPNGFVRKYKTLVIDEYKKCTKAETEYTVKCDSPLCQQSSECKDTEIQEPETYCDQGSSNMSLNFSEAKQNTSKLHSYRNYTIVIQAFTKCWGVERRQQLQTKLAVPETSPSGISVTTTSSSIHVSWQPLNAFEEGNGPIKNYTIRKTYENSTCSDKVNATLMNETIIVHTNATTLENLQSYWDYNLTISASTVEGEGPESTLTTYRTNQSIPGAIETETIKSETETKKAIFNWSIPCLTNGIITNYSVDIFNNDTNTNLTDIIKTEFKSTSAEIQNLDPYSNYTIAVRAFTEVGPGAFSQRIPFQTEIDAPVKPTNVSTNSTEWSILRVSWDRLEKYTGPTNFTVYAIDTDSNETFINETGYDFHATECLMQGLRAFWNYTVYVIAKTDEGQNKSESVIGTTAESTPGNVTNVTFTSEHNVTKPRTLTVSWDSPLRKHRNGVILSYFVQCTKAGDQSVLYSFKTDSNVRSKVVEDISPGSYEVKVFAATVIGNGTHVTGTVMIDPGAPIKKNENSSYLLMQPSESTVSDDERQIAVKLPLKDLLCNINNGPLTRWGVIVSQDNEAIDSSFTGTIEDFNKKVNNTYKSWFGVKDMDSIPPYIATPVHWKIHCKTFYGGHRRKRAAEDFSDFIVGEDGKCSGVTSNKYCNGELQPGRKYRVKSFVCTDGGCTETKYSEPIATAPEETTGPDLTVAIAAGVTCAIIVIVTVAGVTFFLRRRKLVCFSKDDESFGTHTSGVGINLDSIEPKTKHLFRPGPVRLSEFPNVVEEMHKDSDLLFADAYRLLKEKSPNHPITASEQQCCRPKNRYTNILPFDHSRVKLRPSDDIEGSDYINANYIPGYTSKREYIATQGPMIATFDDFWRMVWEQNVDTIVMLTKLMEKGRHKCDKYWPDVGEPVYYGDLVVSLQSESNLSDYIIKIFEIKLGIKSKKIKHFHFLQWPDFGCPDKHWPLINFISIVRQYRPHFPKGPLLVHCSAGVGRTGTFIAMDYLLQHIRDHDEVDIFSFVLEMRNHRLNMVQTEDQYVYIHECLKAFITTDEEAEDEEEEEEHIYMNTAFQEENIYENSAFQKD